jgi:hypothetical protein
MPGDNDAVARVSEYLDKIERLLREARERFGEKHA